MKKVSLSHVQTKKVQGSPHIIAHLREIDTQVGEATMLIFCGPFEKGFSPKKKNFLLE